MIMANIYLKFSSESNDSSIPTNFSNKDVELSSLTEQTAYRVKLMTNITSCQNDCPAISA